ncbi:methyltransferase [Micromonospora sp. NPDC093277]|uniref:methyltransferase n=1 Tax=Micromonospora sp. NPDC093277 TaxID=3364291 RepID=UPI0037FDA54D
MVHTTPNPGNLSPAPLMQLATGFWAFKTFAGAVELELFTRLANGRTITVPQLCAELDIEERPADLLLAACASLGLLQRSGAGYRNSPIAEEFLVIGKPYYFGGFVRFCDEQEYPAWQHVVRAIRTNRPITWDPDTQESVFTTVDPVMLGLFWDAMHSFSTFTARTLCDHYDFGKQSRLLDVGGGSGAFAMELCRRNPQLTATVFDLPHVRQQAEAKIAAAGLADVVDVAVGDFTGTAPLPTGYDMMLLSHILHDWDDRTGRDLLAKCHAALEPGGILVISELMLNAERTGPPAAALMGMNMLVETRGGKNYSETEYQTWLAEAGFARSELVRFEAAGANGVVVAHKATVELGAGS